MQALLLILLLGFSIGASAEIYRWVDQDGNVIYSDRPHPDAEVLEKTEVQTVESPQLPEPAEETEAILVEAYNKLEITSPANEETIRDNTGNVAVSVAIEPALHTGLGHELVLYVNDEPYSKPGTATQFMLTNMDRDSYAFRAVVVDGDGEEVQSSATNSIYLKRHTKLLPPPKAVPFRAGN